MFTMSIREIHDWTRKLDEIAAVMSDHIGEPEVKKDLMRMCQDYQHALNACTHELASLYNSYKFYCNAPPKDL